MSDPIYEHLPSCNSILGCPELDRAVLLALLPGDPASLIADYFAAPPAHDLGRNSCKLLHGCIRRSTTRTMVDCDIILADRGDASDNGLG